MTRQLSPLFGRESARRRGAVHAVVLALLTGCSSEPGTSGAHSSGHAAGISAGDFRAPGQADRTVDSSRAAAAEPVIEAAPPPRRSQPLVVSAETASGGLHDVAVLTGDPRGAVKTGAKPMEAVTLDALVGQINGKPIYAEQFFSPLDARLRSLRGTASNQQFDMQSLAFIRQRLMDLLRDELLTAEARAELSQEQRQGLLYYLNQLRDNLAANYGGSREEANARLLEREGRTFEGQVDEELKQRLQGSVVRKHVVPRVNVSWRDQIRQYEKEYLSASRESTAMIRMIQIDAGNAEAIHSVTEGLAAGKPFAEVATVPGNKVPVIIDWPFQGEYATAKLSGFPVLNDNAHRLTVGNYTGPFDFKNPRGEDVKVWMMLEEIRTPATVALEDVQLKLHQELFARKWKEEENKFLLKLMERASYTPLEDLERRLVAIAAERYPSRNLGSTAGGVVGGP